MSKEIPILPAKPKDLDISILHHPSVVKAHRQSVEAWANQCQSTKRAAEEARIKAETPKILTDDEYYELRLAEQQRITEARLEREAQEERERLAHQQYLSETPSTVTVSATNLYAFCVEVAYRGAQGYKIDGDTLTQVAPIFYSVEMNLATAKKVGK